MKIGAPTEKAAGEARVAITPESAKQLLKLGHECLIQKGAGAKSGFSDDDYRQAGVSYQAAPAHFEVCRCCSQRAKPDKSEINYSMIKVFDKLFGLLKMRLLKEISKLAQQFWQWIWCRAFRTQKWIPSPLWPTLPDIEQ